MKGHMGIDAFRQAAIQLVRAVLPGWDVRAGEDGETILAAGAGGHEATLDLTNFYRLYRHNGDLMGALRALEGGLEAMLAGQQLFERTFAEVAGSLMVQLSPDIGHDADLPDDARTPGVPGPFGLIVYPMIDGERAMTRPTARLLAVWGVTVDEAVAAGRERTRAALAAAAPLVVEYGGIPMLGAGAMTVRIWENATPGYDATRLLWPELLVLPPRGRCALVLAHDRDFVASIECAARDLPAAIAVSASLRDVRAGYPRRVLPATPLLLSPDGDLRPAIEEGAITRMLAVAED